MRSHCLFSAFTAKRGSKCGSAVLFIMIISMSACRQSAPSHLKTETPTGNHSPVPTFTPTNRTHQTLKRQKSDTSKVRALIKAIRLRTVSNVVALIDQGTDPNAQITDDISSDDTTTPLIEAVIVNDPKIVTFLLRRGAKINERTEYFGNTALIVATGDTHLPMMRLLVHHGADVNVRNDRGVSPLILTIDAEDRTAEMFLKKAGAK